MIHFLSFNSDSSRRKCKTCACGWGENLDFVHYECGPFWTENLKLANVPLNILLSYTYIVTANVSHPSEFSTRSPTRTSLRDLRMETMVPRVAGC